MKFKIPKKLSILGKDVEIEVKAMEDNMGEFRADTMKILIDPASHKSQKDIDSTIIHECYHVVLHITGLKFLLSPELEEGLVRALEHGMETVIELKSSRGK